MSHEKDAPRPLDRRDFLRLTGAAGLGLIAGAAARNADAAPAPTAKAPAAAPMPTRNLGRTGHPVRLFSLGGQSAIEASDNYDVAVPIIDRALDLGVNYIDTAAFYGDGWSQRHIGAVMQRRRREVFLATKTHDRTRDGSKRLLEESLRLLQTDHLDLWQIHNLSRMDQVDRIFAKGGAMEALLEARDQKIVRFLGVTGHADPAVLIEAIRRFGFDTILLALNAADAHKRPFAERLLPLAVEKRMGIIGMKIPARGRLVAPDAPAAGDARITMREAMAFTLSLPVSTVIVGCDSVAQVEENVAIARAFTPMSDTERAALSVRVAPIANDALFFRNWG
jgi:aryl-alcohol dehydrogenase-like predicted oxidoreductase